MAAVRADFVVMANRLPVDRVTAGGRTTLRTSPGGLVTAMEPVLKENGGAWIGWHGVADEKVRPFQHEGMRLVPVHLTSREVEEYYEGMSNGTLWPLYHDVIAPPSFHREWWDAYVDVNQRFAKRAAEIAAEGAVVWVQDYHLQLVPALLRVLRPDVKIGFFLHIPFPPTELFQQLPWRRQILEGLLGADLIGFQLPGAAQNFVRLARQRLGHRTSRDTVHLPDGRDVRVKAFPISIASADFAELAKQPETEARALEIRASLGAPKHLLLGIDRLDYTKGLRQRIRAFGELLMDGSIQPGDAAFVQVATPSRERVDQYRLLRDDIERLVGRINGDTGRIGTQPIVYLHTSYPRAEMAALYRAADVMVVTPLRDGMNLVAKEYVACQHDDRGTLILSEFAGAAKELKSAFTVNPYDINGMKNAFLDAMHANPKDAAKRMRSMRKQVMDNDIAKWAATFLSELRR